jgi:hypothetical protein
MKNYLPLSLLLLFAFSKTNAQQFTKITGSPATINSGSSWGVSWIDYDNDGDLDLFINDNTNGTHLFLNDGTGKFIAYSPANLLVTGAASIFTVWGDYDNDGKPDCFTANEKGVNNILFHQNNKDTFTQIKSGDAVTDGGASFGCSWIDYNKDGYLDLFVTNLDNESHFLYKNVNGQYFTKVTTGPITSDKAISWTGVWGDYDNDGNDDLFVANTGKDNLYHNNGDGTFTKITTGVLPNNPDDTQGASWGDIDNDGDLDLVTTNWKQKNALYLNNGKGQFTRVTTGIIANDIDTNAHLGSAWGDYDNDGDLDLYVCNYYKEYNFLYSNNGDGTFTKITNDAPVNEATYSIGCAWGDMDNDGFLDLYVTNAGHENFLFHNNKNSNSWINIKCEGISSNHSAIGTKVHCKATINGKPVWQMREIESQTGHVAQNMQNVHFGLGDATKIDSLHIEWPSGATCDFTGLDVKQFLKIKEDCTSMKINAIDEPVLISNSVRLFPNPASNSTELVYELSRPENVKINITDLMGREVAIPVKEMQLQGRHSLNLNRQSIGTGLFFYRIQAGNSINSGKIIFLKP